MAAIATGGCLIELEVVVLDDRECWLCPVGGARCGRVLVDLGTTGLDALTFHTEIAHPHVLAAWRVAQRAGRPAPGAAACPSFSHN
ncbi:hypothetical protein [Saccharopolyspora dendranthemae]|uniref:Uncharacterized protein n=1 Tax=Saccharopolyspora dendranthemae TaxID=1181886 RepID=A0A561U1K5_9PSEU|nr:hypothetical protein [Saccharopolyspora dendranthemae]TWF93210.1 hypothetical protein FHU35_1550 [Saccharopolyspora dendranthemae]